jgi:hypothetical protein
VSWELGLVYIGLSALARLQATVKINEVQSCRKSSIGTTDDENLECVRVLLDTIHDRGIRGWCRFVGVVAGSGQGGRIWNGHAVQGSRRK